MDNNRLGEKLQERRRERKLTLLALSEQSGVSPSYLGRVENGKRFPSVTILRKLAKPLGFTEMELLKLAGYLASDDTDDRIARFKVDLKGEITRSLATLLEAVDRL